jgi:hypothetical protein
MLRLLPSSVSGVANRDIITACMGLLLLWWDGVARKGIHQRKINAGE